MKAPCNAQGQSQVWPEGKADMKTCRKCHGAVSDETRVFCAYCVLAWLTARIQCWSKVKARNG